MLSSDIMYAFNYYYLTGLICLSFWDIFKILNTNIFYNPTQLYQSKNDKIPIYYVIVWFIFIGLYT